MKTRFYWVALFTSAALIAQAQAGGHHGGGFAMAPHSAPAFHSAPHSNFGAGRFNAPGPGFSSYRAPMAFREQRFGGSDRAFAQNRQFAPARMNHRIDASRTVAGSENRFTRNGQVAGRRFENRGANAAQQHVFAHRTASWHRDWDRHHDHFWNGHRCRFINGEWFIYDTGFYPYGYGYPYDYYPYEYDPGVYEDDANYYSQGAYDSSGQVTDSTVAGAQTQLARQGYYRGEIDGIVGPETRRAIMRYQSDRGLRVTGRLNADTLRALESPRVGSN
jgi:hypothetical protein